MMLALWRSVGILQIQVLSVDHNDIGLLDNVEEVDCRSRSLGVVTIRMLWGHEKGMVRPRLRLRSDDCSPLHIAIFSYSILSFYSVALRCNLWPVLYPLLLLTHTHI